HLLTDKNWVSDAPNGSGPFTPKFIELLDGTGIQFDDTIVDVVGHYGPHPQANQITYDFLVNALKGIPKNTSQYVKAFQDALAKLGKEAATPGTPLNKALTDH